VVGTPTRTRLFSDNLAAVESCKHRPAPSSQKEALEVKRLLKKRKNLTLEWCPGHQGVAGNEQADEEARQAAQGPVTGRPRPTVAWVKAQARKRRKEIVEKWWNDNAPDTYKALGLGPHPDNQGLTRPEMSKLVAYRTGHGKLATHFERFNIEAPAPECECGAVVVPRHLTQCPRRRKVVQEAKEKYKIGLEEEVHQFFLGRGHKGIGARQWFPRLFK